MAQKRKNTAAQDTASKKAKTLLDVPKDSMSRSTRSKSKSTERSSEPAEFPERAPKTKVSETGDKISGTTNKTEKGDFELVGTRDHLKVGTPAPEGRVLTFRNKITKEEITYTYSRKDDEIDWNVKEQVELLNKWRLGLFSRKLDDITLKVPWIPQETAYLELMYQKLSDKALSNKNAALPHQNKIREAFNGFFMQRADSTNEAGNILPERDIRDASSFGSYVNRKGSTIKSLRDPIQKNLKDKSDDAWVPDITDAEIEAHLRGKLATAPTRRKRIAEETVGNGKETIVNPTSGKQKDKTEQPAVVTGAHHDSLNNVAKPVNKPKSSSNSDGKKTSLVPTPGSSSAAISEPTLPSKSSAMPGEIETEGDPPSLGHGASTNSTSNAVPLRSRPPPRMTTDEEFAKLKEDGWHVPEIPGSDGEALEQHRISEEKMKSKVPWHIPASGGFNDRLKRRTMGASSKYKRSSNRELFSEDPKAGGKRVLFKDSALGEALEIDGDREDTAASGNALRGLAIVPPLGYQGDLKDLVDDTRFSEPSRNEVVASGAAIKNFNDHHDEQFEKHPAHTGSRRD
jgi:hypothetical protein